jgi:hypothetical protein
MKTVTRDELKKDLRSRLQRYARVLDNEEALAVLDETDARFGLHESVFDVLRTHTVQGSDALSMAFQANAKEVILAKEGARAYSSMLRHLVEATRQELREMEKGDQDE